MRRDRIWLLVALACVLAGFGDVLLQQRTFVGFDHAIEYFPTWVFVRASILKGELPLWDPRANCGTPCLAAVYSGALDPVRWAFFPLPATLGYTLHVIALHLLAAAGAFRLARATGARPWIAAVAAVLLGSGGPLRSLGGFEKELSASAWVPWALLLALHFARAPKASTALLAGAVIALMVLAGGPEWAIATGVLLFCTALARLVVTLRKPAAPTPEPTSTPVTRPTLAGQLPLVGLVLIAGLVAALLSLGVILPARELADLSTRRSGVTLTQVYAHATHPLDLATLVIPGLFGNSAHEWRPLGAALYGQSYFLSVLYPGLLVILLAPFAPWRSRAARGLGLVALLAIWCALGERAGLFRAIMELCPPLQAFRYSYKAWAFAAPALAVLGALGLERVVVAGVSPRARRLLLAVGALGLALALLGAAASLLPEIRNRVQTALLPDESPLVSPITAVGLKGSAFALLLRGSLLAVAAAALASRTLLADARRERALVLFSALALLDLTLTTRQATPTIPQSFYENPPILAQSFTHAPTEPMPRFYPESRFDPIPRRFDFSYDDRYWDFDKGRLRANLATAYGLPQLHNYNPGRLVWWNKAEWWLESQDPLTRTRLLAFFEGDFVVSRSILQNPWLEPVAREPFGPALLYRNLAAPHRYEVVHEVERLPRHQDALRRATAGRTPLLLRADSANLEPEDFELPQDGTLTGASLSLTPAQATALGPAPAPTPTTVTLVSADSRRTVLELAAPARDGDYLLARDTWEPRWTATVDDRPAPLLRADFCFRAVPLPAGARRVVFEYDASLARFAFSLQALAWALTAFVLSLLLRRGV